MFNGERFVLVNVAFDRRTLDFLERRYFGDADWPRRGNAIPASYRLDRLQLAHLGELTRLLVGARPTRLLLERFLLELLNEVVEPAPHRPLPAWLQDGSGASPKTAKRSRRVYPRSPPCPGGAASTSTGSRGRRAGGPRPNW